MKHLLLLAAGAWLAASACAADAQPAAGGAARRPADTMAERVVACIACHGEQGRATTDGYYPRIAGKPEGYLFNQLVNFREGRRQNPTMSYLVANLPDAYLREIARYFSSLNPPYAAPTPPAVPPATLERGRVLALQGDTAKGLPACAACHGSALTGVAPAVPGLIGLPRDYLNAQFGGWSNRVRRAAAPDCMAQITQRLSPEDLGAVTAYLASQTVPEHAVPAAAPADAGKPPLECGSMRSAP